MKSNRFSRFLLPLCVAAVLLSAAGRASGQCVITGPSEVCGTPVSLCGPDGSEFYVWTFPDGSMQYAQCITVTAPGSYELRFIDEHGEWVPPCVQVMTATAPAPVITGGTSTCLGESLELCGPAGDFDSEWTGPGGFAATTACVFASAAGTFRLRVRARPSGCWSEWDEHAVSFTDCAPPPPPPGPEANCPRPAWWWSQQCPGHDHSGERLDHGVMAAVSECVASRDAGLSGNFCQTMLGRPRTLEVKARRQIATAWANVCADELGVASRDGRPVSLSLAAAVQVAGFQGTVGAWLESAEGDVLRHAGSGDRRAAQEAFKRVIRVGWHINRGIGIGEVCPPPAEDLVAGKGVDVTTSSSSNEEFDPEPLAAELMAESEAELAFGEILPNPFASQMAMAYSITTTGGADIVIGIYDVSGRLVRELERGTRQPGTYVARWDGRDDGGAAVRGGMYFVLGRLDGQRVQSRVTLVR